MTRYIAGNSDSLADLTIDYKRKRVTFKDAYSGKILKRTTKNENFHYFFQTLMFDKLARKNYVTIKNINNKIYQFPYPFYNNKFDYKLIGDYSKYIEKVRIKLLNYKYKTVVSKKIKKNKEHWTAIFYFSKVPRKGRIEIIWN